MLAILKPANYNLFSMRKSIFAVSKSLYNQEEIKQLNEQINQKKELKNFDSPAKSALKTSEIEFVRFGSIAQILSKFISYCYSANNGNYGFDLFPVTGDKIFNYNIFTITFIEMCQFS